MSVLDTPVIRQCLSFLPIQDFHAPLLDYRKQKLTAAKLIKVFLTAQLSQWPSLNYIETAIRSDPKLQSEFELQSISKSQLSRGINQLPVECTEALFRSVLSQIQSHTSPRSIVSRPLALVDSTNIRLPFQLAHWTNVTKHRSGIKLHTRLLVVDHTTPYPDKVVPSTGNVSDYEGSDYLVLDRDVTYVMDRGYVCYKRMQQWVNQNLHFVIRINTHHHAEILEEAERDPKAPHIVRDATVILGKNAKTTMTTPVRLVEFYDEQKRLYRLATTHWDKSAAEIAEMYRQRWLIELFFKWMKQHLKLAKLYSYQPEAVWNHVFLALVAYGLTYLLQLTTGSKKTLWEVLMAIRQYALKPWEQFLDEVTRVAKRTSKGRQQTVGVPPPKKLRPSEVVVVKVSKRKR